MAGVPITTTPTRVLVWCLIAMVAVFLFQESRWGLRLRASREDEVAARASGIGVYNERRTAWILSSFIVGIGGALYGQFLGTFNADAFYFTITFMVIAMLVVGGRTSLAGAVIGSGFISIVAEGHASRRERHERRAAPHPVAAGARGGRPRHDHGARPRPAAARPHRRPRDHVAVHARDPPQPRAKRQHARPAPAVPAAAPSQDGH